MEQIVFSVMEMAQALGISRTKAYSLIKEPGFPIAKVGKRVVIPIAGLSAWLAAGGTAQEGAEA